MTNPPPSREEQLMLREEEVDTLITWLTDEGGYPTGIEQFDTAFLLLRHERHRPPIECPTTRHLVNHFFAQLTEIREEDS